MPKGAGKDDFMVPMKGKFLSRAPTRAKKVRDSSSFKPNILLGHLSFELEMVEQSDKKIEHKFDGNKMELEDSVGAMEDIN